MYFNSVSVCSSTEENVVNRPISETVKSEVSLPLIAAECVGTGNLST